LQDLPTGGRCNVSAERAVDAAGGLRPTRWPWSRRWRYIAGVVVALLAIGAFLLWGPIGIGNGPLSMGVWATQSWPDPGLSPIGTIIPVNNSGGSPAVIDAVQLVGNTRYPAPRLIALELLTSGKCGGAWPARSAGHGFVLAGCGGTDGGPVIGHAFGPTPAISFGYPAAAELAAPQAGGCWVLTAVVVHYHVGIRSYVATDPDGLVVCADNAAINAATNAALAAGPG
jgi:hypothetical protein